MTTEIRIYSVVDAQMSVLCVERCSVTYTILNAVTENDKYLQYNVLLHIVCE